MVMLPMRFNYSQPWVFEEEKVNFSWHFLASGRNTCCWLWRMCFRKGYYTQYWWGAVGVRAKKVTMYECLLNVMVR